MSDAKACRGAVSPGHDDLVPGFDPAQKREMGVAVGSVDGGAGLAGVRRTLQVARSKGKRLTTAAGEYDRVRRDRKSTRLNSSHVRISYAVFCLKKKKKNKVQKKNKKK